MKGPAIRDIRRRFGITQNELAEQLGVDQGTVSRWEREVETPRPASLARLQSLMRRDEDGRHLQRSLATVRHDLRPATLLDPKLRLIEFSHSAGKLFRDRGQDPAKLVGVSFESYLDKVGCPEILLQLNKSGLLSGDALLFTFTVNSRGRGNTTVWEPIVEDGALQGVINYATRIFEFPDNAEFSYEHVGFIPTSDPTSLITLHEGSRAGLIAQGPPAFR